MKLFLFLYVSYLPSFWNWGWTEVTKTMPSAGFSFIFKIFSKNGDSSRISRSSNRLNSQIREVKTMNLIMRGTLAKRGFKKTLLAYKKPTARVKQFDILQLQLTRLKLRNECEILKNEIYSVKSELKVYNSLVFWWFQLFHFFKRLRKFVFKFGT